MTGEASACAELRELRAQLNRLRAENARLLRLLELTPAQTRPPGPTPTAIYERAPAAAKVAFFHAIAMRGDVPHRLLNDTDELVRAIWFVTD